jgi:anti-anti-sigma regulatory factor
MTVLIKTSAEGLKSVVSVAGRLEERDVSEFMKTCLSAESELVLDLTNLRSVDPVGIGEIQELVQGGAILRGASPFIRLLLDSQQPATTKNSSS